MALMTKSEVIQLTFTRQLSESRIPTDFLEIAQHKYIRKVLGEDFYDAVVATPASYTTLLTYIKPVIGWYVKYMVLPELRYEISDLGANQLNIQNAAPLSDEGFALVRNQALIAAEERLRILNEYLDENASLYPLYSKGLNVSENVDIVGGIIMNKADDYDFYAPEQGD